MASVPNAILFLLIANVGYEFVQAINFSNASDICKYFKAPEHGQMDCFKSSFSILKDTVGMRYKNTREHNSKSYIFKCRFICEEGYKLIGPSLLECLLKKQSDLPTCQQEVCGKPVIPPVFPPINVVNGSKAVKGSYPWQAQIRDKALQFQFCAGTLINNEWVLTAAHCVEYESPNSIAIGLGYYQRDGKGDRRQMEDIDVTKIFVNDEFDYTSLANDVALVKLSRKVVFTDYISPACLPDGDIQNPQDCGGTPIITGWGNTQGTAPQPNYLQQAKVPYIDTVTCNRRGWYDKEVLPGMFCAGYKDGGVDTCQGDSGGPVVCKANDDTYKVHGITSWGYGCAEKKHPGVYTRVYYYRGWIDQIIANDTK